MLHKLSKAELPQEGVNKEVSIISFSVSFGIGFVKKCLAECLCFIISVKDKPELIFLYELNLINKFNI